MVSNQIPPLDGISLASNYTVRNLGVINFDQNLSFNVHFKQLYRNAFLHLCNITKISLIIRQFQINTIQSVPRHPPYF